MTNETFAIKASIQSLNQTAFEELNLKLPESDIEEAIADLLQLACD